MCIEQYHQFTWNIILVTLRAVTPYPIDAPNGISEEDFICGKQMLRLDRALVDFDAVGQGQIDDLHAHGSGQTAFF